MQEGQPEDLTERKSWPWWKVQKWLLNILHRLYSRYGDPKTHAKGSNERAFAELWQSHCSQQFLEDQMAVAARLAQVDSPPEEIRKSGETGGMFTLK